MTEVCTCGHDREEHKPTQYSSRMILSAGTCSGFVMAYPPDPELDGNSKGREVYCHCTSFMQADPEQLKEWGIDG